MDGIDWEWDEERERARLPLTLWALAFLSHAHNENISVESNQRNIRFLQSFRFIIHHESIQMRACVLGKNRQ
jgi:hypothetical protein